MVTYDEQYPDDYSLEQVKEYMSEKGYDYKEFLIWMQGQTCGIAEDGTTRYYQYDVERYREHKAKWE